MNVVKVPLVMLSNVVCVSEKYDDLHLKLTDTIMYMCVINLAFINYITTETVEWMNEWENGCNWCYNGQRKDSKKGVVMIVRQ